MRSESTTKLAGFGHSGTGSSDHNEQGRLDGNPLAGTPTAIDAEWGYVRAKLDNSGSGVHNISTSNASGLGLQVIGFGHATSYYYPGGLNLIHISDAPMIVVK